MKSHTTSADIFDVVENQLSWKSLAGVCMDEAPTMIDLKSGFIHRVKERNPSVIGMHCVLHREALASRSLPPKMKKVLDLSIEIISYIKARSLKSHLFKFLFEDMQSEHIALLFYTNVRGICQNGFMN